MENRVKEIGNMLVAASSVFFLQTSFEMYFLTLTRGPQMLFFSMAHGAPIFFLLVLLSGIAFVCLGLWAFGVTVLSLAGKLNISGNYRRLMLIVLIVQVVHSALLLTYERWASALFANGGS